MKHVWVIENQIQDWHTVWQHPGHNYDTKESCEEGIRSLLAFNSKDRLSELYGKHYASTLRPGRWLARDDGHIISRDPETQETQETQETADAKARN